LSQFVYWLVKGSSLDNTGILRWEKP